MVRRIRGLAAVACALAVVPVLAGDEVPEVRVAVAANFKQTCEELCSAYFSSRKGRCTVTSGASGLLAAKVAQGAPFDVFLSADAARALKLESDGLTAPGSRFTYAIGRLAFWRPGRPIGKDLRAALADPTVRTLAIANPGAAPYGKAALETLRSLGAKTEGRYTIVQGESVAQAFQFVASGAADAGFVAWSQVLEYRSASGGTIEGEVVEVSPDLHRPIEQQAVLLATARDDAEARGLLEFMRTAAAKRIIEAAGYSVPNP